MPHTFSACNCQRVACFGWLEEAKLTSWSVSGSKLVFIWLNNNLDQTTLSILRIRLAFCWRTASIWLAFLKARYTLFKFVATLGEIRFLKAPQASAQYTPLLLICCKVHIRILSLCCRSHTNQLQRKHGAGFLGLYLWLAFSYNLSVNDNPSHQGDPWQTGPKCCKICARFFILESQKL